MNVNYVPYLTYLCLAYKSSRSRLGCELRGKTQTFFSLKLNLYLVSWTPKLKISIGAARKLCRDWFGYSSKEHRLKRYLRQTMLFTGLMNIWLMTMNKNSLLRRKVTVRMMFQMDGCFFFIFFTTWSVRKWLPLSQTKDGTTAWHWEALTHLKMTEQF